MANLLYFPMIFLSGAAVPQEVLSDGMRRIADVLPLTYAVDALRGAWTGTGAPALAFAVLGGIIVGAGVLSARIFRWE